MNNANIPKHSYNDNERKPGRKSWQKLIRNMRFRIRLKRFDWFYSIVVSQLVTLKLTTGWSIHAQKIKIKVATNSARIGFIHFWKMWRKRKAGWCFLIDDGTVISCLFDLSITFSIFISNNSSRSFEGFLPGNWKYCNLIQTLISVRTIQECTADYNLVMRNPWHLGIKEWQGQQTWSWYFHQGLKTFFVQD